SGFFDLDEMDSINARDSGVAFLSVKMGERSRSLSARLAEVESLSMQMDRLSQTHKWVSATPEWIAANANDATIVSARNLVQAVQSGRADLVEALLKNGCSGNTTDESGESVLILAARDGFLPILSLLVKSGAWPDPKALIEAAARDDEDVVRFLLDDGVSARGLSLHSLAKEGSAGSVEVVGAAQADTKRKDENGSTPLLLAAGYRNYEAVEALLRHGADPNAMNPDGLTPLQAALFEWEFPYAHWESDSRDPVGIADLLLR